MVILHYRLTEHCSGVVGGHMPALNAAYPQVGGRMLFSKRSIRMKKDGVGMG